MVNILNVGSVNILVILNLNVILIFMLIKRKTYFLLLNFLWPKINASSRIFRHYYFDQLQAKDLMCVLAMYIPLPMQGGMEE